MFALSGHMSSNRSAALVNDATLSDLTGSSKLLVPGKVIASTSIPQGALSLPINPQTLKGETEIIQISVGTNIFGTLELEAGSKEVWNSNIHWSRALRLADDCHSYNIQLRKDPHHVIKNGREEQQKLVLQAVRPVESGQELLLWFSEDILATLHMGFLTPANIQGQKNYVCTRCSALYESPNPLKLHMTLGCGKQSMTWLWERLSQHVSETMIRCHMKEFQFKLIHEPGLPKQKIAIDLSAPPDKRIKEVLEISKQRHSAFKPFNKMITATEPNKPMNNKDNKNSMMYHTNLVNWPRFTMPNDYVHTPYLPNNHSVPKSCDDDAQMESLVSSLGKYKEGHVCLYCGKSYSRKYGLKIHIRTHTGYKPLKCKYCLRPFGDPSNLNKHVRLHAEGETPYKCDFCGKVLVRRRDLERHMKSRHANDINTNATIINDDDDSSNLIDVLSDDEVKSVGIRDEQFDSIDNSSVHVIDN